MLPILCLFSLLSCILSRLFCCAPSAAFSLLHFFCALFLYTAGRSARVVGPPKEDSFDVPSLHFVFADCIPTRRLYWKQGDIGYEIAHSLEVRARERKHNLTQRRTATHVVGHNCNDKV
jgi:hypothetical protein